MENKGLLFIPDISGFTRFVNETEIEHSRLIIQELLGILIDSNQIGLEVSEIEGDAILFYRFGNPPALEQIYSQVEKMFCEFHKSLIAYDNRRYCQCKACMSAIGLTLKVITHYGEFTGYTVQKFNKLIGKDIIVAHQLLKNDIPEHEYWLVTKNLLPGQPSGFADWMQWNTSTKKTESGEVNFHFTQLSPLKDLITPEPVARINLADKIKLISVSREYGTDIITLFHATGDFSFRHQWREGVKKVEELNHFLPRVGMKCRTLMENGEVIITSSSYYYHPDRIEFSESDESKKTITYYTLERRGENKTMLTLDHYQKIQFPNQILFNLFQKNKMESSLEKSLHNLEEVVKNIHLPQ